MRRACLIGGLVLLLVALFAGKAGAVVVRLHGRTFGVMPHRGVRLTSVRGAVRPRQIGNDNGTLDYHGGPVLHSSTPYLIFWDPNNKISAASRALLERYFTDVAADSGKASNVYAVATQYTDGTGNAAYAQTFSSSTQAIVDTNAYPARDIASCDIDSTNYPHCLTDTQIQDELSSLITSKSLPTGLDPIYFVVTPSDTNVCIDSADCTDSTSGGGFCAYHANFVPGGGSGPEVLYASIPLFFSGGPGSIQDPKACQYDGHDPVQEPNSDIADVALKAASHEHNETITDPVDGTGWWDNSSSSEDGDECNFFGTSDPAGGSSPDAFAPTLGGTASTGSTDGAGNQLGSLYDQVIGGNDYYIQSEWSNANLACEMRPLPTPKFSFSPTAPVAHDAVGFNAGGSSDPNTGATFTQYAWDFGDGSTGSGASPTHSYATPGDYTVTLTVTDSVGLSNSTSQTVSVAADEFPTPALSVATSRPEAGMPVSFSGSGSSDPDGSITSWSWSFGDGSSASGASAKHVYARAGKYNVVLTVEDSDGQAASVTKSITVAGPRLSVAVKGHWLRVTVDQAGTVKLGKKSKKVSSPGVVSFRIPLTRSQRSRLHSHHGVKLRLQLVFTPQQAAATSEIVKVKLRK